MPTNFSFSSNTLTDVTFLSRALFTSGSGGGVDDPRSQSIIATNQTIESSGDVDVFAISLKAGQTYTFDIDRGAGGSNSIDLQLDLINDRGSRVATSDDAGGGDDPRLVIKPDTSGIYYVAVHQDRNDYINGEFRFDDDGSDRGDYIFSLSTPKLPSLQSLSDSSNDRSFSDSAQRVLALAGNDTLRMRGGDDIAHGGSGNDQLYGGSGTDELFGSTGDDRLFGGSSRDMLVGGSGFDRLYGGDGGDDLNAGAGNDLLLGESGADTIWGESGKDRIYGGGGDDFIRGGFGVDTLYGGTGDDTFHFLRGEGPASDVQVEDRIEDLESGDRIDFSDLYSGTLEWRGTGSFTDAFQVRAVVLENGYIDVRVNLDFDSGSELEVLVDIDDGSSLGSSDFIL
ncbi:calcium-binding protein [Rubellimicrobium arenae]|uniref:calcium-binding protein n=1 Tax=Rubellimicrobium arenae TaxID=2817372 RepID=UPI001B30572A|nr:pre-peptidase C-terminal domain-containing protein [Rubellimicrobium arenae]